MEQLKKVRIKDKKAIEAARKPYCEYCGCSSTSIAYHVHHIKSKGSGGDDIPDNLINLCCICHFKVHNGNIARREIENVIKRRNLYNTRQPFAL